MTKKQEILASRKRWIQALRSGNYKQGTGWLQHEGKFCCLGVACDLFASQLSIEVGKAGETTLYNGNSAVLPTNVKKLLGLHDNAGSFRKNESGEYVESLASLNDERRLTFEEIADLIESEPNGLFIDLYDQFTGNH